jgi:hypothetical protein
MGKCTKTKLEVKDIIPYFFVLYYLKFQERGLLGNTFSKQENSEDMEGATNSNLDCFSHCTLTTQVNHF